MDRGYPWKIRRRIAFSPRIARIDVLDSGIDTVLEYPDIHRREATDGRGGIVDATKGKATKEDLYSMDDEGSIYTIDQTDSVLVRTSFLSARIQGFVIRRAWGLEHGSTGSELAESARIGRQGHTNAGN